MVSCSTAGQTPLGLQRNNRWGADGDVDTDAWIKFVGQSRRPQLQIEVTGNQDATFFFAHPGDRSMAMCGLRAEFPGGDNEFDLSMQVKDGEGIVFPNETVEVLRRCVDSLYPRRWQR